MKSIGKIITLMLSSIASFAVFANTTDYMIVQCNMNPSVSQASYSDPATGEQKVAASCGEALTHVPSEYTLISDGSGDAGTAAFVNYLFAK